MMILNGKSTKSLVARNVQLLNVAILILMSLLRRVRVDHESVIVRNSVKKNSKLDMKRRKRKK